MGNRKKTGVFTGSYAINDLTGYEMPIYIADYALMGFGTGVVVGVPGHDLRDFEFAEAMGDIEIIRVIKGPKGETDAIKTADQVQEDEGELINSDVLNGLNPKEAIPKMMDLMENKKMGKRVLNYRLRDWLISRQRYWGAPIPIINCEKCGEVAVPEKDLPVVHPHVEDYVPKGKSPLAEAEDFVNTVCPACGGPAKRESQKVVLDVGTPSYFILSGKRTVEKGWLALYGRYAGREDVILPEMNKGDKLAVADRQMLSKETQPPPRFSQGSVLKEMEQKSLGTKSTRAQILQILYNRGYLVGKGIEVTELGMQLSDMLEKNIPDVVSEKLTRHFEQECDEIESGQTSREMVLKEARTKLIKICNNFRKKELKVGKELTDAVIATQDRQSILGACRACGGTLRVHKNWRTGKRFAGCSGYSKGCRTGFPLPRLGMIMPAEKQCEECKTPIIHVRPEAGRPFRMCLDPLCKTKSEWLDMKKLKAAQHASIKASKDAEKNKCELCGKAMKSGRALTMHEKKCKGKALIDEKKAI